MSRRKQQLLVNKERDLLEAMEPAPVSKGTEKIAKNSEIVRSGLLATIHRRNDNGWPHLQRKVRWSTGTFGRKGEISREATQPSGSWKDGVVVQAGISKRMPCNDI
jgi:hypothetical protein